jgi:hypothetical protein
LLRKDYIVRQLEEFGKVMAVILGYKNQNDWERFEKEIEEAARKFSAFEIKQAEELSPGDFEKNVVEITSLLPDQKRILAELLFEKMLFYAEQKNEKQFSDLRKKCLSLYRYLLANCTENEFDLGVHYRIKMLEGMAGE